MRISQKVTDICQVCGYKLISEPREIGSWEYVEICPCCRMHYGNYDFRYMMEKSAKEGKDGGLRKLDDATYNRLRQEAWRIWRENWIANGMPFFIDSQKPENWNPVQQLRNIGIFI